MLLDTNVEEILAKKVNFREYEWYDEDGTLSKYEKCAKNSGDENDLKEILQKRRQNEKQKL